MKNRFKKLNSSHEVINPSTHNFEELVEEILEIDETEQIGKYIDTSFSQKAEEYIHKTFDYLRTMVEKTFINEEYVLTKFYLKRILNLEDIYKERQ